MPQESPLQAVLSDSVNRVNATISNDAVQRYTDKARRRLTEGTVGGVIQLLDFEIVATHIGSRANRITLFVTNFKSLGANGSGLHGSQMPQAIEDRPAIRVLIEKLKDYRKGVVGSGLHSKQQTPSKASSLASQLNSPNNASQENQTDFATQAPPPKFHPNITGSPKLPSNDAGWKSRVSKRNVQALVEAEMPRLSNGELEGEEITKNGTVSLHQQNVPINGRKAAPTTEADLLGLIVQAQRGPNNKVATRVSAPAQPSAVSSTRHSPSTVSPTITQPHLLAVDRPSSVSTSRPQPPSISEGPNVPVEDRLDQSVLQASGRESNTSNVSAYARNRISRRDVTISKDQEALLNSSDCK